MYLEKLWKDLESLSGKLTGTKTLCLAEADYLIIHSYKNYFNVSGSNRETETSIKFVLNRDWNPAALWGDGNFPPPKYSILDLVVDGIPVLNGEGFMDSINGFILPYLREGQLTKLGI